MNHFNPSNKNPNNNTGNIPVSIPVPYPEPEDELDPTQFLINYNEKFKQEQPVMFRDQVIQQTLSCLIGKFKPNAMLTGASGVGKTKIVEDISRRIEQKDPLIPDQLLDYQIFELPLSNIVAGSHMVGDAEKKTKAVIDFARCSNNKVILFIDEIHMLIDKDPVYSKIAQIMKPALARGEIRIIGATTLQEYQNLKNDPAFNRRFTMIIVDELSKEQTGEILKQLSVPLFNHYGNMITVTDKVIQDVISVADSYKTIGSHRPDNAITLLDRAMADAVINRKILENNARLANDQATLQSLQQMPVIPLSRNQLKKTAMKLMTGNNEKTTVDISLLRKNLEEIKGQDETLGYIVDAIERDSLELFPRTKPMTMLFAGNTGVGKSEVAAIIARTLTGMEPIDLEMTEYHSPASINRIIGSPVGYIGSESKTEYPFDILESNPYQVIVLNEFEKADKAVQRLFMSAFDNGYIKMSKGKIIDFSKSIIIATTNAGYTDRQATIGLSCSNDNRNSKSISDLSGFFDTELLNRFTKILHFQPITKEMFETIIADKYQRMTVSVKERHPNYTFLADELDEKELKTISEETFVSEFGARPVAHAVKTYIENIVIAYMSAKKTCAPATVQASVTAKPQ